MSIYTGHINECHVIGTESALIGGKNEHLPLVTLNWFYYENI